MPSRRKIEPQEGKRDDQESREQIDPLKRGNQRDSDAEEEDLSRDDEDLSEDEEEDSEDNDNEEGGDIETE
jgi:hypothetical protein